MSKPDNFFLDISADRISARIGNQKVAALDLYPSLRALNEELRTTPLSPIDDEAADDGKMIAYLASIELDEDMRGQGTGTRLVDFMLDTARRAGTRVVYLHAADPWSRSTHRQEAYWSNKFGFRKLRFDDGSFDAPPMRLVMSPARRR